MADLTAKYPVFSGTVDTTRLGSYSPALSFIANTDLRFHDGEFVSDAQESVSEPDNNHRNSTRSGVSKINEERL